MVDDISGLTRKIYESQHEKYAADEDSYQRLYDMYNNIKKNRIKIDETFYETRILNKEYDVVIDLNKEFLFDISLLINNLKSKYKIGMKKYYADYLYNIQYNFSSFNVLEKIYNQMFLILK